jgi:coproporphyrinogen III oxidase
MTKEIIEDWFKKLQEQITSGLEAIDGKSKFREDVWKREEGGGGRSRIIENGNVLEKGGVMFSAVHGKTPEKILQALKLSEADFYATGVSIVIHPVNPWAPIIHMNVRYFEMSNGTKWFGGGIDLTPHYVIKEDAAFFHKKISEACGKHGESYYKDFKKWADDYFFIKHRNETRGIGGIFFDKLSPDANKNTGEIFEFVKEVGNTFLPVYGHLLNKNKDIPYKENEKQWQKIRRGRYVEFNLIYDIGTKFGLDTNGRTESILVSMPPEAIWKYDFQPEEGSKEKDTLALLKKNINWLSFD